tara:strand:+ start:3888 stop:6341 length:2454 start_codon:yes stop_codon:yes gene_type:complete
MKENFSKGVQRVLKYAKEEAVRLGHSYVGSEHLLLGILKDGNGRASGILSSIGCDIIEMKSMIEDMAKPSGGTMTLGHLPLTRRAERILRTTFTEAQNYKEDVANQVHLLLALAREDEGLSTEVLSAYTVDYELLTTFISSSPVKTEKKAPKQSATPTLDIYSRDLSSLANDGKLDPVVGRDLEVERVAQILSRRKKNNPVLIGEPGVGKTAIVEGLALRIHNKTVPHILWGQRVLVLDLAGLIAGTKYRGQFEERMRTMMLELEACSNIIVFIDEVHTIVGAGGASGSLDAANMFKPALARGEIQIIGATTLNEYRKYIEKDGALERRFQKVIVNPPSIDETVEILNGIKEKYEDHHQVTFSDQSISACVELSDRYITDKFLPDKAIDILDEVGSHVHIHNIHVPDEILDLEKDISIIRKKKETVIAQQKFEQAADMRDKERKLLSKLKEAQDTWDGDEKSTRPIVSEDDVADIVSMVTGIPLAKIAESESVKLLHMADELKKYIIGQDDAIEKLALATQRARAGLKNPNKPIGSFIFLGPTGVGKTELSKVLASYLFTNRDALVKIDMSEYVERYNVSRLIGAPPGYVGYEEGGQLTEKVRRNPYSVVLFDEIEKAHRDVYNILLQILDEGRITDSLGRMVDFRNTIIIMTSNIGTSAIKSTSFGFKNDKSINQEDNYADIMTAVKKFFIPEFLNRIDEIIVFNSLSKENLYDIIDLQLNDLRLNLEKQNNTLKITKAAKEALIREGLHREWGARPLRRMIQNKIENEISTLFLTGKLKENGVISIKTKNKDITFEQHLSKKPKSSKRKNITTKI